MLRTANTKRPTGVEDLLDAQLIARLGQLDLTSRKIFAGKLRGERRSKKRGESVEFADHRPYVSGDDLRHVDWNVYARLDQLFLKLFLEEEDLSLHLVIDCSESHDFGEPNKFLFAQRLAMSLAYIGLVNLNRVAITAIGGELLTAAAVGGGTARRTDDDAISVHALRDLRGRRRTADAARFLCSLTPGESAPFGEACKRIALSRRGRGVMVVISDFLIKEGYEDGLRLLVGRGYDVFCMQVLSPQEVDPERESSFRGDLRLRDGEDLDRAEITVSGPLLKKYRETVGAYCDALRMFCAQRQMMCLSVQSDTPIDVLMLDYLRRRGLLR